ncbi:MAG: DUF4349 domain-containing protein [Dermatophilaceae bacterium]
MHPRPHPARLAAATLAVAVTITALGACGGSDDSGAARGSAEGGPRQSLIDQGGSDRSQEAPSGGQAAPPAAGGPEPAARVDAAAAVAQRTLTRRADVALKVEDVAAAAARLRSIATTADGLVVGEEISTDHAPAESGATRAAFGTMTISVPADALDDTLDDIAEVGVVLTRTSSTQDVTAQYVDTESRVESATASVERVRALMSQATKLADVVSLEAELSRRQADLEALQGQLAALDDATALSPITVRLSTDGEALPADDDTGFLAGLASGWGAFTSSVTVLLTALGAALPFGAVFAAVGVPLAVWLRRRRTQPTSPSTAPPSPVGPPAG